MTISLAHIDALTGGRVGTFNVPCPICSAYRSTPANFREKVLRIWRFEHSFATFHCVHCGEAGYTRDRAARRPDPVALEYARKEAAERERVARAQRLNKARWLWSVRVPITGTIAETYLREARGYSGPLPATLGFLPPRGRHGPAMIAAFGPAHEVEPGVIAVADIAVTGVHITRLLPDGSDRERGEQAKIMIGRSIGSPIVLAAPNDLLGLAVTEGIEDALSVHEATGLGSWAAGCASRMPALAAVIPAYINCVTVLADDDAMGRRDAAELSARIQARAIEARLIIPNVVARAA
jgi:hypothetical protein